MQDAACRGRDCLGSKPARMRRSLTGSYTNLHLLQGTVLVSLLQPTPETYDCFDDIMVGGLARSACTVLVRFFVCFANRTG